MRARRVIGIVLIVTLAGTASVASAGTFSSGSTGANGAFPPSPPATYTEMQLDLVAGNVKYYNGTTLVSTVAIAGGSAGFPTGVLNFTTIDVPSGKTLKFLRNAANTTVTMLATGNVTISGTLSVDGQPGRNYTAGTLFPSSGAGGPGGLDGGAGGNAVNTTLGGVGLGPGGGAGGATVIYGGCPGGGGGFGKAGQSATYTSGSATCTAAAGAAYGNPQLVPLVGGSGGGGGGMVGPGYTSGGGGGGGGALLIASSGSITLTGTIAARGGTGGTNSGSVVYYFGGGGSGGAVRLVSNTLTGTGSILVTGGAGMAYVSTTSGTGGPGRIRLEAYTNTLTLTAPGTAPSLDIPRAVFPTGSPSLRITTVGGQTVPATPTGSFYSPDVTLPSSATSPVAVAVTATAIPDGTAVIIRARPYTGAATSVTTAGLSGGTATGNLPMDLTQPSILSAEATFTLSASLDSPIKYAGEDVTTVKVTATLGGPSTGLGTGPSQVRYFTASGKEVPEHAALALGLPR